MERRKREDDKEKSINQDESGESILRVKVMDFDNTELKKKHALTLIGRVTNAKQQRIWALISFFSNIWNTTTRAIGTDLGQGLFQFQFANAEDMNNVLKNRPYHFAKWMIILQKWEESTDPTFPSLIPFWIKVQGLPVHLWCPEILTNIGKSLGTLETVDITETSARIRVQINGHKPLVMKSIVEFADGSEVMVHLTYEKLANHCYFCKRLDHDIKGCSYGAPVPASEEEKGELSHKRKTSETDHNLKRSRYDQKDLEITSQKRQRYQGHKEKPIRIWRKVQPKTNQPHHIGSDSEVVSHVPNQKSSNRGSEPQLIMAAFQNEAIIEARAQIKEHMNQYVNIADQSESVARQARLHLAEKSGLLEKNAEKLARNLVQIPEKSYPAQSEAMRCSPGKASIHHRLGKEPMTSQNSQERIPVFHRLGSISPMEEKRERIPLTMRIGSAEGNSGSKSRKIPKETIMPNRLIFESEQSVNHSHSTSRMRSLHKDPREQATDNQISLPSRTERQSQPAALKKIAISPSFLKGIGGKKRKTVLSRPSPRRKNSLDTQKSKEGQNSKATYHKGSPSRYNHKTANPLRNTPAPEPSINIIPAMEKKKQDFQNPVHPPP